MSKRQCYYISITDFEPGLGYIPCLVTEDEPGYGVAAGNGDFSRPYYWGLEYDDARAIADKANMEDYGITPDEAREILASSMAASRRLPIWDKA